MALTVADTVTRFFQGSFNQEEQRADKPGFLAFFNKSPRDNRFYVPSRDQVEVDIQKSTGQTLAQMIRRGSSVDKNGTVLTGDVFTTVGMDFGLIQSEYNLNFAVEMKRMFGENPYGNMAEGERRMRRLALSLKMYNKMAGMFFRTESYLASQAILTGTHDQIIGTSNTDLIYNFSRSSDSIKNITGFEWNDATNGDPMGNIDDGYDWISENGYGTADIMIAGDGMWEAFVNNTKVQALAKASDGMNFIQVNMNNPVPAEYARLINAGFECKGRILTPQGRTFWCFTFSSIYLNLSGVKTKYMPTDSVLIASWRDMPQADCYFGPSDTGEMTSIDSQWFQETFGINPSSPTPSVNQANAAGLYDVRGTFVDGYPTSDRKGAMLRMQRAPIYAPTDVDAYYTITNGLD